LSDPEIQGTNPPASFAGQCKPQGRSEHATVTRKMSIEVDTIAASCIQQFEFVAKKGVRFPGGGGLEGYSLRKMRNNALTY
jgi:hypothetical protein